MNLDLGGKPFVTNLLTLLGIVKDNKIIYSQNEVAFEYVLYTLHDPHPHVN